MAVNFAKEVLHVLIICKQLSQDPLNVYARILWFMLHIVVFGILESWTVMERSRSF